MVQTLQQETGLPGAEIFALSDSRIPNLFCSNGVSRVTNSSIIDMFSIQLEVAWIDGVLSCA